MRDERDRLVAALDRARRSKTALPLALRSRQLCFLHIGKTAGTSIQHILMDLMADAEIFHASLPEFDAVVDGQLDHYDFVIGHFTYRHVAKLRADRFLLTFLRDPVERVLSTYHFLRAQPETVDPASRTAIEAARALDLRAFLLCEEPLVRMYSSNFQCRVLASDHRPTMAEPMQDLLAAAETHLSRFDFVGISERLDESVQVLSEKLHLPRPLEGRRLNVNAERTRRAPPSPDEIGLIRDLNRSDAALYAAACVRFDQLDGR